MFSRQKQKGFKTDIQLTLSNRPCPCVPLFEHLLICYQSLVIGLFIVELLQMIGFTSLVMGQWHVQIINIKTLCLTLGNI